MRVAVLTLFAVALSAGPAVAQTTLTVVNSDDSINSNASGLGGTLRYCLLAANSTYANGPVTINFQPGLAPINLEGELPLVMNRFGVTFNGNGNTIDGGSTSNTTGSRGLFLGVGAGEAAVSPTLSATTNTNWAISNLTIRNTLASGGGGGSGGAGLGGAIFLNAGNLALTNVHFLNNRAVGGSAIPNTGGGGGMGGNGGGIQYGLAAAGGGGGGGFGGGADGGSTFTFAFPEQLPLGLYFGNIPFQAPYGAPGGGSEAPSAQGGYAGGGGQQGLTAGAGGGVGGQAAGASSHAGNGGFGGGGGGGYIRNAFFVDDITPSGNGGFGGGSGSIGNPSVHGGFGGGAGYRTTPGFGGGTWVGDNSLGFIGGGGLGAGAAVFVRQGATLSVTDGSFAGGVVQGGTGGSSGAALGSGIFLAGGATYSVSTGNTVTLTETIGGGTDAEISGVLGKAGNGTLVLSGNNSYTGGTVLFAGTLGVGSANALGTTGSITFLGGTLQYATPGVTPDLSARFYNGSFLYLYRVDVAVSQSVTFATGLSGQSTFAKLGGGTLKLTGANTYTGGTAVDAGELWVGNNGTTGSIAGNVVNSGTLQFARSDDVTYAGVVSGTGQLVKSGTGSLTLTAAHTYTGPTTITQGNITLTGTASIAASPTITVNGGLAVTTLTGGANYAGGSFALAPGQTLKGTGAVLGDVRVPAGTAVAPGNSVGTLTVFGSVTLPGTYKWELGTAGPPDPTRTGQSSPALPHTNHDVLVVSNVFGNGPLLNLSGAKIDLTALPGSGFDPTRPYSWRIATAELPSGFPTVGTLSGADFAGLSPSQFTVSTLNGVYVNFTPVPEPAAVLGLSAGGLGALGWVRRRRAARS